MTKRIDVTKTVIPRSERFSLKTSPIRFRDLEYLLILNSRITLRSLRIRINLRSIGISRGKYVGRIAIKSTSAKGDEINEVAAPMRDLSEYFKSAVSNRIRYSMVNTTTEKISK